MTNDTITADDLIELMRGGTFRPRGEGHPGLYNEDRVLALSTGPYQPLLILAKDLGLIIDGRSPLNAKGHKKGVKYTTASFSPQDLLTDSLDLSDGYTAYVAECHPAMKDTRDIRRSYLDGLAPGYAIEIYSPN